MKHTLIALALAGALAVPVFSQTSSSQPQSTTPSATDQQNSSSQMQTTTAEQQAAKDNAATATQKQPLSYERHEGFWGKMMPFARKKYVQKQLSPVRDRVNELDELTAANSKAIKDVDSRATEGIRLASLKANEADQHAVDAGNRAKMAQDTASQASTHLDSVEKVVTNIDQFQPVSQTEILFRPGQRALSKKAKDALDDMATPLKDQKGYIVEVQGFSSGKGQAAISNSQAMAQSVVRYLVLTHDIPVYRIYTVGMGNAPVPDQNADGTKPHRVSGGRVEISLLKNGVGDLSTAQASTPTSANQEPNQQPQESTPR
jgi:flagellar motor protein MotB